MPLLADLRREPWWDREIVTDDLDWLGDELCRLTGRPREAFGTKGHTDRGHMRGGHRSQEWILNSQFCTDRSYTVQKGLTADQLRHIAGGDFTPGNWGTQANRELMAVQTKELFAAARAGLLTGVTQIIGTLDGRTVTGLNVASNTTFSADLSHLDHWHLTFDRRYLRDRQLMQRILRIVLQLNGGETTMHILVRGSASNIQGEDPKKVFLCDGILRRWIPSERHLADILGGASTTGVVRLVTREIGVVDNLDAFGRDIETLGTAVDPELLGRALSGALKEAVKAAAKAGAAEGVASLAAEFRDAVADLGEGGAAQVREDKD